MSNWRVEDQSSSTIMEFFYKYLTDGINKDKAFRLTKLEYFQDADPIRQHPFYWNNFVILGNTSPLIKSNNVLWTGLILGVMMLLIAVFLFRHKYSYSQKAA